ncbi:hypothetical protein SprV_0100249100 [Sparganum proliferum]
MERSVDVLIIGAGVAGLTAAMRLRQANINDILVLDARDRIGGRVATTVFRGVELSTGPAYVHGDVNNPISRLVKQLKLPVHPPDYSGFGTDSFAARLASSGENVASQFEAVFAKHHEALHKLSTLSIPPSDQSAAAAMTACGWNPASHLERTLDVLHNDLYSGLASHYASAYSEKVCCIFEDGEDTEYVLSHGDGFRCVVEHLARNADLLNDSNKLTLSTIVDTVIWRGSSPDDFIEVHGRTNGVRMQWRAKHVLVTVPPTLLFPLNSPLGTHIDAHISFDPPLPTQKQEALRLVKLTNYCRVLVAYQECFWDPVDVILRIDDLQPVSEKWGVIDSHPARKFVYWQNLSNFMSGFEAGGVLCTVLSGYWAELCSKMTADELAAEVGSALASMYPEKADIAMKPLEVKFISWKEDAFAGGAFATALVGFNKTRETELCSSISAGAGQVHFAGDGYRLDYLGTVQGAFMSAIEAANKISGSLLACPSIDHIDF